MLVTLTFYQSVLRASTRAVGHALLEQTPCGSYHIKNCQVSRLLKKSGPVFVLVDTHELPCALEALCRKPFTRYVQPWDCRDEAPEASMCYLLFCVTLQKNVRHVVQPWFALQSGAVYFPTHSPIQNETVVVIGWVHFAQYF